MLQNRFDALPEYAFPRLRALLAAHEPGGDVIDMSIGEPKHAPFPGALAALRTHEGLYNRYPPIDGTPGWRGAVAGWLARRYGAALDPDTQILPLNGTREGLFTAAVALVPPGRGAARPVVLIPNPFYQCYAAAALAAGAEPVFVNATAGTGYLPDFDAVPEDVLSRTAMIYLCAPSNPQGAVASRDYLTRTVALSRRLGAVLCMDECYSEIYFGEAPAGILSVCGAPEGVLAFHSLSKRSNLAGLRSGFVAGDAGLIGRLKRVRSYGGAPNPLPAIHAAQAAWEDEDHVAANRALYAAKFEAADRILSGMAGYTRPSAGFFLWIAVGDGEAQTLRLWREAGLKVLPGAYLSRPTGDGDPGAAYLRAALVAPLPEIEAGLSRLRSVLEDRS